MLYFSVIEFIKFEKVEKCVLIVMTTISSGEDEQSSFSKIFFTRTGNFVRFICSSFPEIIRKIW